MLTRSSAAREHMWLLLRGDSFMVDGSKRWKFFGICLLFLGVKLGRDGPVLITSPLSCIYLMRAVEGWLAHSSLPAFGKLLLYPSISERRSKCRLLLPCRRFQKAYQTFNYSTFGQQP
ncbi:hypothetical protein BT63DRAFT_5628 [Microthyrium microscopicum]|uniref:Uncharacterized protein n=1 Tax=Microthyrium microscopicum TaxID=703497 RepID=A0A6A6UPN9_9PEZI|nr:hypothetical protein BT63DRAFT_5628 [Microthyrium microscopicum]